MDLRTVLKGHSDTINRELEQYLPKEEGFQQIIFEAANYSVRNGGKRLRPILIQSAYILCRNNGSETLDANEKAALMPIMAAMEMIHSSSLVHDDLPCMDNDTLRRGVPSTWAKFGEDFGTLAGDALMIYAFETAAKSSAGSDKVLKCIDILAHKAGVYGMIGGQTVDVQLVGQKPSREQLEFIYRKKTGALIEASFMMGAVLAGASEEATAKLERAADCIGMAFQIQDDILDVTSTEAELGKPIGSDEDNNKITWLSFYGLEQSRADVKSYTERALKLISAVGEYPFLNELLVSLIDRKF